MKYDTQSTEERIKEAARKVFLEKGFDGTTTRDIAREAHLNTALLNYYFRSKEKLFASVFEENLGLLFQGALQILNKPIALEEKISQMIDYDFQMLKRHPGISIFVHNELHQNPDRLMKLIPFKKLWGPSLFDEQLKQATSSGAVRPIEFRHLIQLLVSNIHFIFHGKLMTMTLWEMGEKEFEQYAEKHKAYAKTMILHFLFTGTPPRPFFLPTV